MGSYLKSIYWFPNTLFEQVYDGTCETRAIWLLTMLGLTMHALMIHLGWAAEMAAALAAAPG